MEVQKIKRFTSTHSIWLVLVVMVIFTAVMNPRFLSMDNLHNILMTEAVIGILAAGVMWCILAKGIDLSLGSVVALVSVVSASFVQVFGYGSKLFPNLPDLPIGVGVAAGIAVGTLIGLINGLLVAYTKVPSLLAPWYLTCAKTPKKRKCCF